MAESYQEKTEEPTARVLEKARNDGNLPRSQDLTAAAIMLAGSLFLAVSGAALFSNLQQVIEDSARQLPSINVFDHANLVPYLRQEIPHYAKLVGPLLGTLFLVALAVSIYQTGGVQFSTKAVSIKPEKLDPVANFHKLWSLRSIVRTATALARLLVILVSVAVVLWVKREDLATLAVLELDEAMAVIAGILVFLFLVVALILFVLGVVDWLYQRWQWKKDLRMTKQEVKDEHKSNEGDPQIKRRIRQQQQAVFERSLSSTVKGATLVVTNPTHYAVALKYEDGQSSAPIVVAKGVDQIAEEIKRLAREFDVPVFEQPTLARTLFRDVPLGKAIPERLYRAVANALAFVYRLRDQARSRGRA